MKLTFKLISVVVLFFCTNLSIGQKQTLFVDKSYDAAFIEAQTQKKPLIIMFYATWCAHCNKMKNEVFTNQEVVDFYKQNYICMAIDAESEAGIRLKNMLQNKFKVRSYPTFAFLDSNENFLYCMSGEFKSDIFITEGKNTLLSENQYATIKSNFYNDVSNADNCLKYITILKKAGFDATEVTQKYLKTKSESEIYTELNWRIMANGISDFDSEEFKNIVKNSETFAKVSSPTRVEKKIVYVVSETFKDYANKSDTTNYFKRRPIAESFKIRKIDSLLFTYDMLITSGTNNWKKYQKTTEDNVEKFALKNSNLLTEICTNYLDNINDKKGLQNAVIWSNKNIENSPSLDKYILTSKLLKKLNELKHAIDTAQKGKAFAQSLGWKTDEIDKLIAELKTQ